MIRADWQQEDIEGNRYRLGGSVVWRPTDRITMSLDGRYTTQDGWLLHRGGTSFATLTLTNGRRRSASITSSVQNNTCG